MIELCVAVLALVVGPFLRLLADRVPGDLPLLGERPDSGESGVTWDLAPVVSWFSPTTPAVRVPIGSPDDVAEGEARDERIWRWRAPAIDLAAVVVLVSLTWRFGAIAALPAMLVFGASLVVLTVIDIDHFRLPDRIVFPTLWSCALLLGVASFAESVPEAMFGAGLGSVLYFAFLLVPRLVFPAGMGLGDVKLALVLGLVLGWTGAVREVDGVLVDAGLVDPVRMVFYGCIIGMALGAVPSLIALAVRGRNAAFPYGPTLCVGALVVVLFSESILG